MAVLALSYNIIGKNVKRTKGAPDLSVISASVLRLAAVQGTDERPRIAGIESRRMNSIELILNFFATPGGCGTQSALTNFRSRRCRRGGYFVSHGRRRTTYPFVILSKLSPRYGDHAHHGILRVSRSQGY